MLPSQNIRGFRVTMRHAAEAPAVELASNGRLLWRRPEKTSPWQFCAAKCQTLMMLMIRRTTTTTMTVRRMMKRWNALPLCSVCALCALYIFAAWFLLIVVHILPGCLGLLLCTWAIAATYGEGYAGRRNDYAGFSCHIEGECGFGGHASKVHLQIGESSNQSKLSSDRHASATHQNQLHDEHHLRSGNVGHWIEERSTKFFSSKGLFASFQIPEFQFDTCNRSMYFPTIVWHPLSA